MRDEPEKHRSAFGNVLYEDFLVREGMKKITQKTLTQKSGVSESVISRMVSHNSTFAKGKVLYDDIYAIIKALATPEMVGDISVEKAERLIQKIPDENLSRTLKSKLIFTLTNEKIIKPMYTTLQGLPLLGRDDDIQEILDKLQKGRLVVITGIPGVGKSELAYQVAEEAKRLRQFSSAKIIYLENETSTEKALKDIRIEFQKLILEPQILFILDNCEQLEGFTGELLKILTEDKRLRILATSRVAMTGTDHPIEPLETNDAVQLFLKAAKKRAKNFTLTKENAETIEAICRYLDGLPLAIIFAASWVKELGVKGVYTKFVQEQSLKFEDTSVDNKRHKSLYNLIEASYELLQEKEQQIFRRLGIFYGTGCSAQTAQTIYNLDNLPISEDDFFNAFKKLSDHHLITFINRRIEIAHKTLTDFALQKINENTTEMERLIRKYVDYYYSLVLVMHNSSYYERAGWYDLIMSDYRIIARFWEKVAELLNEAFKYFGYSPLDTYEEKLQKEIVVDIKVQIKRAVLLLEFLRFIYIKEKIEKLIGKLISQEEYQVIKKLLNGESYGDISTSEALQISTCYSKVAAKFLKEDSNYPYLKCITHIMSIYRYHRDDPIRWRFYDLANNTIPYFMHRWAENGDVNADEIPPALAISVTMPTRIPFRN